MSTRTRSYQSFLSAYVNWCKDAIRSAAADDFQTLRQLRHPFVDFVLDYIAAHHLDSVATLEASLARLLRLNAELADPLAQGLHEEDEAFWSAFVAAARADARRATAGPIRPSDLVAGRKSSQEVLKRLYRELRPSGAQRPDSTTVTLFCDIGPLSMGHFFDSGSEGFSFWTAVRFPDDRVPRFKSSYAGMLGIMLRTSAGLPDPSAIAFSSRLALTWRESFERFVRSWIDEAVSPSPSVQRTPSE